MQVLAHSGRPIRLRTQFVARCISTRACPQFFQQRVANLLSRSAHVAVDDVGYDETRCSQISGMPTGSQIKLVSRKLAAATMQHKSMPVNSCQSASCGNGVFSFGVRGV